MGELVRFPAAGGELAVEQVLLLITQQVASTRPEGNSATCEEVCLTARWLDRLNICRLTTIQPLVRLSLEALVVKNVLLRSRTGGYSCQTAIEIDRQLLDPYHRLAILTLAVILLLSGVEAAIADIVIDELGNKIDARWIERCDTRLQSAGLDSPAQLAQVVRLISAATLAWSPACRFNLAETVAPIETKSADNI